MARKKPYDPNAPGQTRKLGPSHYAQRDFDELAKRAAKHKKPGTAKRSLARLHALDYGYPTKRRGGKKRVTAKPPKTH